jgi:c-di-GMP-binding flagellar brake protein YcgR
LLKKRALAINNKVEIIDEEKGKPFKSIILSLGPGFFTVTLPYEKKDVLLLSPGTKVKVRVIGKNEQFLFTSEVLARRTSPFPHYVLKEPEEIKRVQLREYVRLKKVIKAQLAVLLDEDRAGLEQKVLILDISGGGVSIALREPLAVGSKILLKFNLPGIEKDDEDCQFKLKAEIRRCERSLSEKPKFIAGAVFLDITEKERDGLIRYIFRKMLEQHRMER